MRGLVLSLFSGLGMLDQGFREEGFCVVSAGDICWGPLWDIREFHPPPRGVFRGIIGGPPCQQHSSARGGSPSRHPDLTREFARVVTESDAEWWVMENVPACPAPFYGCHRLDLNARWLGMAQSRARVFFSCLPLQKTLEVSTFEHPDSRPCAATSYWKDGRQYGDKTAKRFLEVVEDQGLPAGFDLPWFTVAAKVQAVCNGVPLPMARAVARAVVKALKDGP